MSPHDPERCERYAPCPICNPEGRMAPKPVWTWYDPALKVEFRLRPTGVDFRPIVNGKAKADWDWTPVPKHLMPRALKHKPHHLHSESVPDNG